MTKTVFIPVSVEHAVEAWILARAEDNQDAMATISMAIIQQGVEPPEGFLPDELMVEFYAPWLKQQGHIEEEGESTPKQPELRLVHTSSTQH